MKITLKNFRCHRNEEYEISDRGLVLLHGQSGAGKSTILNAIFYALYGKVRKPYTHGLKTKTCQVTLEYMGMKITRTSRPNRLVVEYEETEYEDIAAQGVIDMVTGMDREEFSCSSYVVQSLHNSVISMTPLEQVNFVKRLAFNEDYEEHRREIKEHAKSCQAEVENCKGRIEAINYQYEMREKELKELPHGDDSLDDVEIEDVAEERDEVNKSISSLNEKMKTLEERLETLREAEEQQKEIIEHRRTLEIEITNYSQMRDALGDIPSEEEIRKKESRKETLKHRLRHTKAYYSYRKKNKKAQELHREHTGDLEEKIEALEARLPPPEELEKFWKTFSSFDSRKAEHENVTRQIENIKEQKAVASQRTKEIIKEIQEVEPATQRKKSPSTFVSFLQKKSNKLKRDLKKSNAAIDELNSALAKKEITGSVYGCPCCSVLLTFKEGSLVLVDENNDDDYFGGEDLETDLVGEKIKVANIEKSIKQVEAWLEELQRHIRTTKTAYPKLTVEYDPADQEKAIEYRHITEQLDELQERLDNKPPALQTLFQEVDELRSSFPKKFKPTDTVEQMEEELEEIAEFLEPAWRSRSEYSSLSREINTRKKELKGINRKSRRFPSGKKETTSDLQKTLSEMRATFIGLTSRLKEVQEIYEALATREEYKRGQEQLQNIEKMVDKAKEEYEVAKRSLQGAIGLEQACKEAEILALEATIESINEHAKSYLDTFFEDDISVTLESHKLTTKNIKKAQLNTVVKYKGYTSGTDLLSGGEIQRCELAFLLAVNDIVASSIIMLDECLNNLDATINMDVLQYLKELGGDKLIVVVSHEAVMGIFDEIITVGPANLSLRLLEDGG